MSSPSLIFPADTRDTTIIIETNRVFRAFHIQCPSSIATTLSTSKCMECLFSVDFSIYRLPSAVFFSIVMNYLKNVCI